MFSEISSEGDNKIINVFFRIDDYQYINIFILQRSRFEKRTEGKHFKLIRHHRTYGESLVLTVASRTSMAHGFLLKWAEIRGLQKIGRSPRANDPNNGVS